MSRRPYPGLGHEVEHGALGIEHFLPAEVFIIPDVPGGPLGSHRVKGDGVSELGKGECVMADGFVSVDGGICTPSHHKVVQLNVFQIVEFIESVGSWPWLNPLLDKVFWVEGVQLWFFLFGFLALLFSFPF